MAIDERLIPTVYETQAVLAQYPGPSTNRRYAMIPSVGMFKWYINDTTTANGVDVVSATGGSPGRWKLMPLAQPLYEGVRVVATTNLALSGALTYDGVVLATNDRVAAFAQSTATQVGIYVVNTSGAWTRAVDMPTGGKVKLGAMVPVIAGTANANTVWMLTSPTSGEPVVGTSTLVFTKAVDIGDIADIDTRVDALEAGTPLADADSPGFISAATFSRIARVAADEWNPSLKGHNLLGWYRHDVNVALASATEVSTWDDVRGLTGYGPQLTPPTAAHRPSQLVSGGPIVFRGEDSPLAYDGLDAACPAAWIGATELTIVLVATPDGTEGSHWGDPDWGVAHLLTVSNTPGTDGVSLLGNTEAYEASGVYAFQGLGLGQVQTLIAASGTGGKTLRQGAMPAAVSSVAMTALAASARLRIGFDQGGGGAFYPANMTVYEVMVFRGRLDDADMRAIEDYVSRQNYGGVSEMRQALDSIGDSLSAGFGASPNEMWVRRLARNMGSIAWNVQAVSGYTIPQMRALARGKRLLTIRERRPKHVAALWGGTNSIAFGATAAATYAELTACIDELLDAYAAVIVPTMLPRVDCTGGEETQRAAYNVLILGLDDVYPGLVYPVDLSQDVGLATIDGTPGYWHADDIHLLDPGYEAVADLVEPVMIAALAGIP